MLQIILFSLLSAYAQEIDRGVYVEPHLGASLLDEVDDTALSAGARVSFSAANLTDAYLSFETSYSNHLLLSDANDEREFKHILQGGVQFVELFNPTAIRFSAGGGVERRYAEWNPLTYYRFGLGGYFQSNLALFGDATFRQIYRNLTSDSGEMSFPLEASFAIHWIF